MRTPLSLFSLILVTAVSAAAQVAPADQQIAAAILAAPEPYRADATVHGYDASGAFTVLREGSGELVCLADAPDDERWSVSCYHRSLEPYMARGRELRAQGVEGEAINERRWQEVEAGSLDLPYGALLYVLHGDGWDEQAREVKNPYLRWVIYTPFATPEETGLSIRQRAPGEPWLMFPGTAGAHIMITPPRGGGS